jgi:hypothetical protein
MKAKAFEYAYCIYIRTVFNLVMCLQCMVKSFIMMTVSSCDTRINILCSPFIGILQWPLLKARRN